MSSIALSALVLFIIVSPGAVLIKAYNSAFFTKETSRHIPTEELVFRGLFVSVLLHVVGLCTISLFGYSFDFHALYKIFIGGELGVSLDGDIKKYFTEFSTYSLLAYVIAFSLGKCFRWLNSKFRWSLQAHFFYNTNIWHELFSALSLDRPGIEGTQGAVDVLALDILTTDGFLYTGYLQDFKYDPYKDVLELIMLYYVMKKKFNTQDALFAEIPGEVMIFPYSTIKNINIRYLRVTPDEEIEVDSFEY